MYKKYELLIIVLFCVFIGWAAAFLQGARIESHFLFWLGLSILFEVFLLANALYFTLDYIALTRLFKIPGNQTTEYSKIRSTKYIFLIVLIFNLIAGYEIFNYRLSRSLIEEFNLIEYELDVLQKNICLKNQLVKISLFHDLIENLDYKNFEKEGLYSYKAKIDRIVALSSSEKISKYWDIEGSFNPVLNLKKGLLLLSLFNTIKDTSQYNKFKENVSFCGADLINTDLQGMNLCGIDLKNANLQYSNLKGANLNNANLRNVNLIGVNLSQASLVGANLVSVKLNRAIINEADLHFAKIDSADLSNSIVKNSNFTNASFVNAIICNANFYGSNLSYSLLSATFMSNVNLSKSVLTNAEIYDTDIGSAILDSAIINSNWSEQLIRRNTSGVKAMLDKYFIIKDSSTFYDTIIYQVIPIKN